jgi:hypothetical protein
MCTHIDNINLLAADYTGFSLERYPLHYKPSISSVVLSHVTSIYENTHIINSVIKVPMTNA